MLRKRLFVFICLFVSGCAWQPELTQNQITTINQFCSDDAVCVATETEIVEDRLRQEHTEEERARDVERWETCKLAYDAMGRVTVSQHMHLRGFKHRPWQVDEDLWINNCRPILKRIGLWD